MHYLNLALISIFFIFKCHSQTHLYELEYEGVKSHLFGTFHGLPFTSLPRPVRKIIEDHEVLITENTDALNPLTRSQVSKMGCFRNEGEVNYIEVLDKKNKTELKKFVTPFLECKRSEVSIEDLNLKGLYASYIGGHFLEGMDYYLFQYFKRKSIYGLENTEQVAVFFPEITLEQLQSALNVRAGFESSEAKVDEDKYLQGADPEEDPNISAELQTRNTNWIPKMIEYHLEEGVTCVGYEHLYGGYGLINLLKDKGFNVRRSDTQGIFSDF